MLRYTVLFLIATVTSLPAAPLPFPRDHKPRQLDRAALVGNWVVHWGSVRCAVTLEPGGEYRCHWGTSRFVGRWWIDDQGRLCIRESNAPTEFHTWNNYAIRLCPIDLAGPIEVGSARVTIRLKRSAISPEPGRDDAVPTGR